MNNLNSMREMLDLAKQNFEKLGQNKRIQRVEYLNESLVFTLEIINQYLNRGIFRRDEFAVFFYEKVADILLNEKRDLTIYDFGEVTDDKLKNFESRIKRGIKNDNTNSQPLFDIFGCSLGFFGFKGFVSRITLTSKFPELKEKLNQPINTFSYLDYAPVYVSDADFIQAYNDWRKSLMDESFEFRNILQEGILEVNKETLSRCEVSIRIMLSILNNGYISFKHGNIKSGTWESYRNNARLYASLNNGNNLHRKEVDKAYENNTLCRDFIKETYYDKQW